MLSTKRKAAEVDLQRRVRARAESDDEAGFASFSSSEKEDGSEDEDEEASEHDGESSSEESNDEDLSAPDAASISFGALAKAQSSLQTPSSKKRKSESSNPDGWSNKEAEERLAGKKDKRDFSRSSKHAPTEQSSKKAVSRRREVIPVAKRQVRDPRFEPTSGGVDAERVRRNYSFLDAYREDEMKELRQAIKVAKDEAVKERLKRELSSMESRKKAQVRKDKEREVLEKHRREEKELVKQGKQPFYLKKSEQKQRFLKAQYGELKGKQLDRVIERRRKKVEGKEKKKMPFQRRGAGE